MFETIWEKKEIFQMESREVGTGSCSISHASGALLIGWGSILRPIKANDGLFFSRNAAKLLNSNSLLLFAVLFGMQKSKQRAKRRLLIS